MLPLLKGNLLIFKCHKRVNMKKIVLSFLFGLSVSYANMFNAIALTVNEEPITVYDIEEKMATAQIKKADAVSELIDEILFNQEIAKKDITADIFDINNHLEQIAQQNGMDLYTFKSIIKQKYKDYDAFEENTRLQVLKQKLAQKIVRGQLKIATDNDMKIFYDNNQAIFKTAQKVKAVQYTSKNKQALVATLQNPMRASDEVMKTSLVLDQNKLNSQLRFLINDTKVNSFTPIFAANKQFVSLLITAKEGVSVLPFEEVKQRIFNVIMRDREKAFLKEYFEKLKLTADIKIIR